jgi:hypothetical protein
LTCLVLFFKLEEEENPALLLHLLQVFAETAFFGSGSGSGLVLVVATVQAIDFPLGMATRNLD